MLRRVLGLLGLLLSPTHGCFQQNSARHGRKSEYRPGNRLTLAENGADVGITSRSNEDGCLETAERVRAAGRNASFELGDLADPEDITTVVSAIREDLGPIDILVNNATIRPPQSFFDVTTEEIDAVQDVNFRGMFQMTQAVAEDMNQAGSGVIVNLLGAMVYLGTTNRTHSFGSKLAIEGLVRQLASELGPPGNPGQRGFTRVDQNRP